MQESIERFLLYLATERGLSDNYQISTRASLERFVAWAGTGMSPPHTMSLRRSFQIF
jgi:site-specific recombinase XerD